MQYGYSSAGDLVEVEDRYGRVKRRFAYKNHLMFAHQELQGPEHTYSYEADLPGAKVLNQYNEQGLDYQFIYQDHGERSTTQVIDSLGRVEHYFFEGQAGLKRLVKHQRFDGTQTKQQHDAYGRLTSNTDVAGRKTYLRRDSNGRLSTIQSPTGPAVAMRHNADGQVVEQRVGNLTTRYAYDRWQRVISVATGAVTPGSSTWGLGLTGAITPGLGIGVSGEVNLDGSVELSGEGAMGGAIGAGLLVCKKRVSKTCN